MVSVGSVGFRVVGVLHDVLEVVIRPTIVLEPSCEFSERLHAEGKRKGRDLRVVKERQDEEDSNKLHFHRALQAATCEISVVRSEQIHENKH